jgi:hypothetical protein
MARSHLMRLGSADPDLSDIVSTLDFPELRTNWLLAMAGSGQGFNNLEQQIETLIRDADLPLPLHLRALQLLDRPASARALVRTVSARLPQRAMRHKFLTYWQRPSRA